MAENKSETQIRLEKLEELKKLGINPYPNTTPEHIARTDLPHLAYVLDRVPMKSKLDEFRRRVRRRVGARLKNLKKLTSPKAPPAKAG